MNSNNELFKRFTTKYNLCRSGVYRTWDQVDSLIAEVKDELRTRDVEPASTRQDLLAQVKKNLSQSS